MAVMVTVGISELKNKLSAYVDKVRRGETVLVLDRGVPVAQLSPASELPDDERIRRLVRKGILRPAKGKLPADFLDRSLPRTRSGASIVDAVLAEREEGW
jgi:prevent-host-death family protein